MINIEEIKTKLVDKLRPSGWADVLKAFVMSSDFNKIIEALEKEVDDGRRFTPMLKDVFTAFEECKWEDLKCVMIGQDPYPHIGTACGVAFDCRNTGKEQPSLKYVLDAIDRTVYVGIPEPRRTNLDYLTTQGVLMINTALTTQIDKPMTHQKIWQAFIVYVLDTISTKKENMTFVFFGKTAQEYESIVSDWHTKLLISHPASAAYDKLSEWDCKDVFNRINTSVVAAGRKEIKW